MISKKLKFSLLAAVGILGYISLSFELIVLKQLVNFVGSNTVVTSIIMAFILMFLSVGYYLGSTAKIKNIQLRKTILFFLVVIGSIYCFSCSYNVILWLVSICNSFALTNIGVVVTYSVCFLVFPSILLGYITSMIGRFVHRSDINYTGRFMAIDTIGSVLGSLVTTLFFMPLVGTNMSVIILDIFLLTVFMLLSKKKQILKGSLVVFTFFFASAFICEYDSIISYGNVLQDDAVARVEIYNLEDNSGKILSVNGSSSSKIEKNGTSSFTYVNFINQNIIGDDHTHPKKKILVLGTAGFTVGLNDDYNEYVYLDIINNLQEMAEENFLEKKLGKNKKYFVKDAYLYLIENKEKYDLIIIDVYSAVRSIPSNFVTVDFYKLVKNSLKDNGTMVANIITSPAFENKFSIRIDNTIRSVFPHLSREIIGDNSLHMDFANIIYIGRNIKTDLTIYTSDRNTSILDQGL